MDYPHPLELLYKFWYLLVHSDWGDYTVWLDNYAIQCGFQVGHYVVQPPQAMEGKWETICNAGEWSIRSPRAQWKRRVGQWKRRVVQQWWFWWRVEHISARAMHIIFDPFRIAFNFLHSNTFEILSKEYDFLLGLVWSPFLLYFFIGMCTKCSYFKRIAS